MKSEVTAKRARRALELRSQGYSYRQIGAEIGVSHVAAFNYVKDEIQHIAKERKEIGEGIIDQELLLLDKLLIELLKDIKIPSKRLKAGCDPDDEEYEVILRTDQSVVQNILKIMERRAKYLGLNAPERSEVNVQASLEELIMASKIEEKKMENEDGE